MTLTQGLRRGHDQLASTDRTGHTGLLLVGFLAVAVAIFAAHRSPATGYEISIYAATPLAFWAGAAVAAACSFAVAFGRPSRAYRGLALVLAGETFVAIVGLPLIRGYEFYSAGDPLSHMGWVRNVLQAEIALETLIYPGAHTLSIYVHRLVGRPVEQSMLFTVVVFATLFVTFAPLVAYRLHGSTLALSIGAFSAMLVLPINNISVHLAYFPSTMAVFFAPFVLLLAVVGLTDATDGRLGPVDWLLGLGAVGLVLYHPQQAANVLLVLVTASVVVFASRARANDRSLDPLFRHTAFLAVVLAGWGVLHERITRTAGSFTEAVVTAVLAGDPSGGSAVAQRTGSLSAIGSSPLELGAKLFLPGLVFAVLTALIVAVSLVRSVRREADERALAVVGLGLVPVGIVMVLYILGDLKTIYFRHLGFMMMLATAFGAVTIARAMNAVDRRGFGRSGTVLGGTVLAVLLVLSLATAFSSPFIHQPNDQVTESRFEGHETAFAHENESIAFAGVRSGPGRFRDALQGTYDLNLPGDERTTRVPYGQLDDDLSAVFVGPRYLTVSEADVQRETVAYEGLRYSGQSFRTLDSRTGIDRVISTGGFRLYYVAE